MRLGLKKPRGRPFRPGHKRLGGRRRGTPNVVTTEIKQFMESVLEDPEYQAAARERMIAGKAPHLETLALHWKHGKPSEQLRLEASTSPSLSKLLLLAAQMGTAERS